MEKTTDYYGVQLTSIQAMKFSKFRDNKNIAMNTLTKEERFTLTKNWLNENG